VNWVTELQGLLTRPAPVWLVLLAIFILTRPDSRLMEQIGDISGCVEDLRRKFCPTESERRRDFFGDETKAAR
jgi:hypothetical protein